MNPRFQDTAGGGVLLGHLVAQVAIALTACLLLRPLFRRLPLDRIFANPPLVEVCFFVLVLAVVILAL